MIAIKRPPKRPLARPKADARGVSNPHQIVVLCEAVLFRADYTNAGNPYQRAARLSEDAYEAETRNELLAVCRRYCDLEI